MRAKSRNGEGLFTLRPRPPLDFDLTLQRYRLWGVDPANVYQDGAFYRGARVEGKLVPFRLVATGSPCRPIITVTFAGTDTRATRTTLRRQISHVLGLESDLAGFYARAREDPVLAPLARRLYGLRATCTPDPFEMLVGAITAQQVNLTFAFAVRARLVRRFGERALLGGVIVYAFPAPAALAATDVVTLRAMQLTTRKAEFIIGLARAVEDGRLDLPALATAPEDEVIARLTALRGLGRWTAEWFLARGLGRPDVCPAEDLGVRRAVEALCFGGQAADAASVRRRAGEWRPFRSLAIHYLLTGMRLGARADGSTVRAAVTGEA